MVAAAYDAPDDAARQGRNAPPAPPPAPPTTHTVTPPSVARLPTRAPPMTGSPDAAPLDALPVAHGTARHRHPSHAGPLVTVIRREPDRPRRSSVARVQRDERPMTGSVRRLVRRPRRWLVSAAGSVGGSGRRPSGRTGRPAGCRCPAYLRARGRRPGRAHRAAAGSRGRPSRDAGSPGGRCPRSCPHAHAAAGGTPADGTNPPVASPPGPPPLDTRPRMHTRTIAQQSVEQ